MTDNGNESIRLDRLSDRFFKYLFAFGHCTVFPQRKNDFPLIVESEATGLRLDVSDRRSICDLQPQRAGRLLIRGP